MWSDSRPNVSSLTIGVTKMSPLVSFAVGSMQILHTGLYCRLASVPTKCVAGCEHLAHRDALVAASGFPRGKCRICLKSKSKFLTCRLIRIQKTLGVGGADGR
jgi:hypothetical protein